MEIKLGPPTPEPVSLPEAIGQVVMAAGGLESALATAVVALSQSPVIGVVVGKLPAGSLLSMIDDMVVHALGAASGDDASGRTERLDLLPEEEVARFRALLKRVRRLLDDRNRVVHAVWLTMGEAPDIHQAHSPKWGVAQTDWTIEALVQLTEEMRLAAAAVFVASWNARAGRVGVEPIEVGDLY